MTHTQGRHFFIQQGKRQRHPEAVLHQFKTIVADTEKIDSVWEKMFHEENERTMIPKEYTMSGQDTGMMVNQMGLVNTALDNFKRSKAKLKRMVMYGN